ncbi:melanoma-associated antigen B3-like [Choloepus didactylus]|uniref:melanoma-associated antigen B3-like n=1 Tax=Choloepus didactylus TaxID=27675 RepID=UPI00189D701B|nr:melanoma-associated antigen B3-like [Choloepus didactylus]
MPWGQKHKRRTNEKKGRARCESQDLRGAQATATAAEESHSSPVLGCITQSKPGARSCDTPQQAQRSLSTTTISAGVSCPRSHEGANCKDGKRGRSSQALQSTAQSGKDSLKKQVNLLVQFLMHKYKTKKPIMKADMMKIVSKKHKRHFLEILRIASFSMEVVFGIDLKEVDSIKHFYDFVSKMDLPNNGRMNRGRGLPKTGLLMTLLGVIFMKGNYATEEEIWEFLNKMKIYEGKKHFIYGEPKKFIMKDLVQEKYLEYQQVPNSDPPCYEFLWGPRAHTETSKMKVLEFLAKINQTVPSAFKDRYEEALRDEEERAGVRVAAIADTTECPEQVPEPAALPPVSGVEEDSCPVVEEGSQCST